MIREGWLHTVCKSSQASHDENTWYKRRVRVLLSSWRISTIWRHTVPRTGILRQRSRVYIDEFRVLLDAAALADD